MKKRLNVLIVLDRSGSMRGSEVVTVSAINEYLQSLRCHEDCAAYVTLKTFDSESIDTLFHSAPAAQARFCETQFVPRAMTPLLDAVGDGIETLDEAIADGELAALIVMTDGLENCSSKFGKPRIEKLLRERQEKRGWMVLFLGADIDAWAGARDLGISADRTLSYSKSRSAEMSAALQCVTARYVEHEEPSAAIFDDEVRQRVRR